MKGTAQFPMCGFSGRPIQVLRAWAVPAYVRKVTNRANCNNCSPPPEFVSRTFFALAPRAATADRRHHGGDGVDLRHPAAGNAASAGRGGNAFADLQRRLAEHPARTGSG